MMGRIEVEPALRMRRRSRGTRSSVDPPQAFGDELRRGDAWQTPIAATEMRSHGCMTPGLCHGILFVIVDASSQHNSQIPHGNGGG